MPPCFPGNWRKSGTMLRIEFNRLREPTVNQVVNILAMDDLIDSKKISGAQRWYSRVDALYMFFFLLSVLGYII